jgi:hypothetical protein
MRAQRRVDALADLPRRIGREHHVPAAADAPAERVQAIGGNSAVPGKAAALATG